MYCPSCKDEFRPGFTRCEGCGVDLVDDLSADPPRAETTATSAAPAAGPLQMLDYCGFLELDDARGARETLRAEGIRSEITIRDAPEETPDGQVLEEYWLRIDVKGYKQAAALLGLDTVEETDEVDATVICPKCEGPVSATEESCPSCGASLGVH